MKIISWNVNGIRAILKKGFEDQIKEFDPDIICLQETKCDHKEVDITFGGYYGYWNSSTRKKGYSGVAIFSKYEPINVISGIGVEEFDCEGRALTLEFEEFYLVNVYSPNSQSNLARIDYRMRWEDTLRQYLQILSQEKGVILCGDLNVAHNEIDLAEPEKNIGNTGFSKQERDKFSNLLDAGFVDSYRYLYPDKKDEYTWWSYISKARLVNNGWRIDYFVISENIKDELIDCKILTNVMGSDHCPIEIEINVI